MKKVWIIVGIALAALILCGTVACAVMGALALSKIGRLQADVGDTQSKVGDMQAQVSGVQAQVGGVQAQVVDVQTRIDEMNAKTEDAAQENDVTIAGEYVIRATTQISDAYKSGDRKDLSDRDKETLDMASKVLEEIITDGMTPYEKEKAVYDWMTSNLQHDSGLLVVIPQTQEDCDNPYGVLKYHNAVCVGYATTFRLFMQMMDIPCMVVHNSECYHSWDLVQLNGNWYHTDIYSDVGNGGYGHFNRTDYMQGVDQNWNHEFFPKADSYEFCYATANAKAENDIYNVPKLLREALDNKDKQLSLKFGKEIDEGQARICEAMLSNIESMLNYSIEYSDVSLQRSWIPTDEGFVLSISIYRYNEEPDPYEFTDEDYEKMEEAVNGSFGDLESNGKYDDDWWTSDPWSGVITAEGGVG